MTTQETYFAHSSGTPDRATWHPLSAHLGETGRRAAAFLERVGAGDMARVAGLLHDLGKYSRSFQERLHGDPRRVDHSTAGAKIAVERYGPLVGRMLAFCVAGHHAGLANGVGGERITSLRDRLTSAFGRDIPPLDEIWRAEIDLPTKLAPPAIRPRNRDGIGFSAAFLTRMLFSALVDADFLDTEAYFAGLEGARPARGRHPGLGELKRRLDAWLADLAASAPPGAVNELRRRVLAHARERAACAPGLFSLTVPTGGGKTLASLAFALEHAQKHGQERVIYVIPFTSIVEQTAAVFRAALRDDGAGFVLEHHSAFDEDAVTGREARAKLRLAAENWDAPVVVTTAVQFFESLFAHRPSRCRKLHNVANAVVILDEAQTLPLALLRPCVAALDELARNYRSTVVLCTATQPALRAPDFRDGFEDVREIAPDPPRLYRNLKRVAVRDAKVLDDSALAARLRAADRVLCIVNTRRHARELFALLGDAEGACHLTTLMCAKHRSEILGTVRARLREGAPVRLVATSLIEAGVDVDFPLVYRAAAGIDSLVQAAGRCNREGRLPLGELHVFEPAEADGRRPPPEVAQFAAAARAVRRRYDDPLALDAIADYFREVYWLKGDELDAKGILARLRERADTLDFPFETIAALFRVIETPLVPVIVPYRGADRSIDRLVDDLRRVERPGAIARRLQPYIVQIPRDARKGLISTGAAEIIRGEDFGEQFVLLVNEDLYDRRTGLSWDDPTFRSTGGLLV